MLGEWYVYLINPHTMLLCVYYVNVYVCIMTYMFVHISPYIEQEPIVSRVKNWQHTSFITSERSRSVLARKIQNIAHQSALHCVEG